MNTPIADFVRNYAARNPVRLHMPGHKGRELLGCEALDITEIPGADELYVADGIIGESERNAAGLFGTGATLYSTEGSSQCIRAMVYLAALNARDAHARNPYILATRNAHKTFLYALALTDLDVRWLVSAETDSLCACPRDRRGLPCRGRPSPCGQRPRRLPAIPPGGQAPHLVGGGFML